MTTDLGKVTVKVEPELSGVFAVVIAATQLNAALTAAEATLDALPHSAMIALANLACCWLEDDPESHTLHHLHRIEIQLSELRGLLMTEATEQSQIDADVASLTASEATLAAEFAAALAADKAANPGANLAALDAVSAKFAADATADVAPAAPVAAPVPPAATDPATPAPTTPVATSDPTTPVAAPVTPTT